MRSLQTFFLIYGLALTIGILPAHDISAKHTIIPKAHSFYNELKAPRPNAPGNQNGAPVGSLVTCNFDFLNRIENSFGDCCDALQQDFVYTWTILAEISDLVENFSTFNNTVTLFVETTETFSSLVTILIDTTSELVTTVSTLEELTSTITALLSDINETLTACCDSIEINFEGTFTALDALQSTNCTAIAITQADIDAASGSYIISTSGNYFLKENIISIGTILTSLIQIEANDVTLDLCQRQLAGASGNGSSGIFIDTATNVTIKNGLIQNMTLAGIIINGGSNDITVDNITTMSCGMYGFQLGYNGFVGSQATNLDPIKNTRITNSAALYSSSFNFTPNLRQLNRFTLTNFGGLFAYNCYSLAIANSFFNQNFSQDVYGVRFEECYDCTMINCLMNENVANQFSAGLSLIESDNNYFENCTFNYNLGNNIPLTRFSVGSGVGVALESSNNNIFLNCQASNNSGETAIGFGSELGSNNIFKECVATNNTSTSNQAYGFSISSETGCQLLECQAIGNSGLSEGAGFICMTGTANVFEYCQSVDNASSGTGAGFIIRGDIRSAINYCTSNNNTGTGTSYGILLDSDTNSGTFITTNCFIQHNSLSNNNGVGSNFGIRDVIANNSTSFVGGNFAFNNGTNFNVTYPGAVLPIVAGSFSGGLPATGTTGSLDNIDINP